MVRVNAKGLRGAVSARDVVPQPLGCVRRRAITDGYEVTSSGERSDDGRLAPSATNLLTRGHRAAEQDTTCGSWHMFKTGLSPQDAGLGRFAATAGGFSALEAVSSACSPRLAKRPWPRLV